MNHELFEELLAGEALNALTDAERVQLETHLKTGCADCFRLRNSMTTVATLLPPQKIMSLPPPHLKIKILAEIEARASRGSGNPRPPRRAWWAHPAWLLAIAAGLVFAVMPALKTKAVIGHIASVEGDIRIGGRPAVLGAELHEGERLTTGAASYAAIRVGDPILIQAGPHSDLSIKHNGDETRTTLAQGSAINLVKPGTHYAMATPLLTTEARGTGFFVNAPSPDRTYVCICVGKIEVTGQGYERRMESLHHGAIWAVKGPGGISTTDVGLENHSDEQIAELLKLFK